MGSPAARLMDPTIHGGMIVAGMPTVMIGGMPAARIGDMHVCPLVTVLVPHVGGPLILGAFTTLVGGPPQSRQGDMAICVGPPDAVMMGCPTVMVGMSPAAGAMSVIIAGVMAGVVNFLGSYPKAVLAADGSIQTQYSPSITISGSPEYQAAVVNDLNKFTSTETGKKWQEEYAKTGKHITIRPVSEGQDQANASCNPANKAEDVPGKAQLGDDGKPGTGGDSTVEFNPSLTSTYTGEDGEEYTMEPHQTLGHELIHGLHQAKGEDLIAHPDNYPKGDNQEEARTIGVHGYEDEEISERQLHEEADQSPRPDHNSVTRNVYQDSDGDWHDSKQNPETGDWDDTIIDPPPDAAARPNH